MKDRTERFRRATRTTCSEMSNRYLPKGIYLLSEQNHGKWRYMRREKPIRTRLFLIEKGE